MYGFFANVIDVLQTLVIALSGGLCVWEGKVTARKIRPPIFMCDKVTHKILIDSNLLLRKNFLRHEARNMLYLKINF